MLSHWRDEEISLEKIIEKMCHAPAECFKIIDRGFLDEGKYGDIVLLDLTKTSEVSKENILYKCDWSPLENTSLPGAIEGTWVNGERLFEKGKVIGSPNGKRLTFRRH